MSPGNESQSTSPRAAEHKVQNGRIEKPRPKKESKTPTYRIGGRTFACEACKKGHRVSKCTHAAERPVSMTHDPGRPSGDQKRHCDCPKQCACTKKNCKCDRNCSCTQTMYMLVYVPMKDGARGEKPDEGEWRIGKEVIADLQGKQLTEEEIRARNELKSMQQSARAGVATTGPLMAKPPPSVSPHSAPRKGCCQHKKNIEQQKQPLPVPQIDHTAGLRRPQCDCGSGCACAFCLDHPNNQTSHLIAQQQAAHFTSQSYGQHPHDPLWAPLQVGGSCMGTDPSFAISNTPNPSRSQFQSLFPASGPTGQGGYFISYPFTRYTPFIQPLFEEAMLSPAVEKSSQENLQPRIKSEISAPPRTLPASSSTCCQNSTPDGFDIPQEEATILADVFDFSEYDIGDAVAAGFHGTSSNPFAYDMSFDPELASFAAPLPEPDVLQTIPDQSTSSPPVAAVSFRDTLTDVNPQHVPSSWIPLHDDDRIAAAPYLNFPTQAQTTTLPQNMQCCHQPCCHHGQMRNLASASTCSHDLTQANIPYSTETHPCRLGPDFDESHSFSTFSSILQHSTYTHEPL